MPIAYETLYKEASKAQKKSYSPYSNFAVGCALALANGTFIYGANIENASYGASICAERVAMCNHKINGPDESQVITVAIIGPSSECITPCGICRQFLREFLPLDTPFVLFNQDGSKHRVTSLEELLPDSFGPDHLH